MITEKLYFTKVIPYLNTFRVCEVYSYVLRKMEQDLAESMKLKNIYKALDIVDFKSFKENKLEPALIEFVCNKLNLAADIQILSEAGARYVVLDGNKYQLIFFNLGTLPDVDLQYDKLIFFMFQTGLKKIYYCGKLDLQEEFSQSLKINFYKKHCHSNTQIFIDFNLLSL